MKDIFEYEFKLERHGKEQIIQQSGTSLNDARRRIIGKGIKFDRLEFLRRFSYPHFEGGKKY